MSGIKNAGGTRGRPLPSGGYREPAPQTLKAKEEIYIGVGGREDGLQRYVYATKTSNGYMVRVVDYYAHKVNRVGAVVSALAFADTTRDVWSIFLPVETEEEVRDAFFTRVSG